MLFEYLRAKPLLCQFTLFSPLSHPQILSWPVFVISKNVFVLNLCAIYVLFEYWRAEPTAIFTISPVSIRESPSDFGITNFCDINECNCATFMCFLCAIRISKSPTYILNIFSVAAPESSSDFGIASFCDIKECNRATFIFFLCAFRISEPNRYFKNFPWFHPWVTLYFGIAYFCDIKECNCKILK